MMLEKQHNRQHGAAVRTQDVYAPTPSSTPARHITVNSGCFRFVDERARAMKPLNVWYYQPYHLTPTTPIVFVMHGTRRDAQVYRDTWSVAAEREQFLLVCPEFCHADYPSGTYHLGNLMDAKRRPQPSSRWAFTMIEHLFDIIKQMTGNSGDGYTLYGHSAGGQFVHRMVLFMPTARFHTAIAANTGWYTMPTFDGTPFPYSLKDSVCTSTRLKHALQRRLVLLLGEQDTNPDDPTLRKTVKAQQQGTNRFERGQTFMKVAQHQAAQWGVSCNWRLETVPGVAHSDPDMMPVATQLINAQEQIARP
jgi:poly(3-hydroxybutyrate) depolymerase